MVVLLREQISLSILVKWNIFLSFAHVLLKIDTKETHLYNIMTFRVKLFYTGLILLLGLVGLSACSQQSNLAPSQNNPIKIGTSISLSGDFSADGKALQQGYQLWQEAVNKRGGLLGRQVQFDFLKDNSTNTQVTTNYQKMISVNHDDLIVGPFSSTLTVAASVVANHYNRAFVEGAGAAPKVFSQGFNNLFSVSLSAANYLKSFVYFILSLPQAQRPHTVAYATSDDFFTQPQIDTARVLLEKGGVKTAFYNVYPAATTNYSPTVQKIISSHPDVVILGTVGQSDCVAYMKAFKQQHFNPSAIIATAGPDQGDQFTGPLGGAKVVEGIFVPNNGWFPEVKNYQNDQFISDYIAKYGGSAGDISADTVEAYSTMQVLEQAVTKINNLDNAKLIQELHSDTFNTLQGAVKFAEDGENAVAVAFLFQWRDGRLIVVYPNSSAQQSPQYPKHSW